MSEKKEAPRSVSEMVSKMPTVTPTPPQTQPPEKPIPPGVFSTPFGMVRKFAEEMDHLFEDFTHGYTGRLPSVFGRGRELFRREAGLIPAEWSPRIDVARRNGSYIVRADLPGLSKDDVKVELTDEAMLLHGERKIEKEEKKEGLMYRECEYGSFFRSIPLPEGVVPEKAEAVFRDGVLEVTLPCPKADPRPTRRVDVKT